jgi:hypothetical protein
MTLSVTLVFILDSTFNLNFAFCASKCLLFETTVSWVPRRKINAVSTKLMLFFGGL